MLTTVDIIFLVICIVLVLVIIYLIYALSKATDDLYRAEFNLWLQEDKLPDLEEKIEKLTKLNDSLAEQIITYQDSLTKLNTKVQKITRDKVLS